MPGGDGTGPIGQGPGAGAGRGFGRGQGGDGAVGPGGECVCPACGTKIPHQRGTPCNTQTCPKCGTRMTRMTMNQHKM